MAFDFSLQTAILGTLGSSLVLSATLAYLWRQEPAQRALLYWSLAFAMQALRMGAQLGVTFGHPALWLVVDILFALMTLYVWLGACHLSGWPTHLLRIGTALATAIAWQFIAIDQELSFAARSLPLYAIACGVLLASAAAAFRLARLHPDVGYRGVGILFVLLGLHYLDYPFLRPVAWFAPIGFSIAATLTLALGIAMLIVTQRRQQFALQGATARLTEETKSREVQELSYRTLVDELDEGIFLIDRQGMVFNANPAAARILNLPLDALRGHSINEHRFVLKLEDGSPLPVADHPMRRALVDGKPTSGLSLHVIRPDGTGVWMTVNTHPLIRPGEETPYAAVVAFADTTARHAAEQRLQASELRFRSVFEAVPNIAVHGCDERGSLIYWNSACERFYGFSRDEALGRPLESLLAPPGRDANLRAHLMECFAGREAAPPGECLRRCRDGSTIEVYSSEVLISNLQGKSELYAIDLDLSEIRRLQSELQEYSDRFRALTESSELGIVVADAAGSFVHCNARYLELVDSTLDEVRAGTWIEHVHPDDRDDLRNRWQQAVKTQTGFVSERRVVCADGHCQWARAHITPIHSTNGDFHGFVATVEDITARKEAEAALRQSEAKFHATFDQAFQFIGLMDLDGILLDANRTALSFAGITPESVLGRPFADSPWWSEPEERAKLLAAIERARNGELVRFETMHRAADGLTHNIDFSLKPAYDADGKVTMLIPEGRDITNLKAAEKALRESEARFAGAFHASLDYITISDIETGRIIDVNEAFERTTGWSRHEAIGHTSAELGIWPRLERRDEAIALLRERSYLREHPMQLGIRDGSIIECVLNASLIEVDGSQLLLGVVRDVSQQKVAAEALRKSEEKFSRIVQYSPTALVTTDRETGVVIDFNRAWQEMLGYSREQAIGRHSTDFGLWVEPGDREKLYRAITQAGDILDRYETRYRRADGAIVYALVSGRLFDIGGRPTYLWSLTDITLRHQMEERMAQLNSELETRVDQRTAELRLAQDELVRSEKLAALGSLVAGVAHELNTPIGNAVTVASTLHDKTGEFAELVNGGTLKRSALNGYLESATKASDLLLRSLAQARNLVASFKQVAVDQTSDQRRRFDLGEVVGEVLMTLSPTIRKTPISVIVDIPEGIVMDSYPGPLGQVVTNFVNNALLHAFEGRLAGTVIIRASPTNEEEVRMTVSDDGNGIPEADQRRIFDPFFTTKLGRGGSGLGLNIVYNIVTTVLGGKVGVDSRVGAGTTFTLKMPVSAPVTRNQDISSATKTSDSSNITTHDHDE